MPEAQRLFSDDVRDLAYQRDVFLNEIEEVEHPARSASTRSIAELGPIHPPLLQEVIDGLYRIIDGARRIGDLRALYGNQYVISAMILPADTSDAIASAAALALNYARAHNPIAEAHHFQVLREHGFTPKDIAQKLGIPKSKVERRLRLLDKLHPQLYLLLEAGEISIGVAERCARMTWKRQEDIVLKTMDPEYKLTNAALSDELRAIRTASLPGEAMFEAPEADEGQVLREAVRNALVRGLSRVDVAKIVEEEAHA